MKTEKERETRGRGELGKIREARLCETALSAAEGGEDSLKKLLVKQ